MEARPCPDAEIEKGSPESERIRGYVGTVVFVWPILSDSHEAPGQPAQGWEWLTHPTIRRLPAGRDLDRRGVGTLRYLAVVRAFERNLPQPLAEGDPLSPNRRRLIAGSHFRPGTFRGGLFIMDIKRAALVCQIPLEVTSRPILDYSPGGAFGTTARDALERDFKKQFLENARAAVRRISRIVRVSYP